MWLQNLHFDQTVLDAGSNSAAAAIQTKGVYIVYTMSISTALFHITWQYLPDRIRTRVAAVCHAVHLEQNCPRSNTTTILFSEQYKSLFAEALVVDPNQLPALPPSSLILTVKNEASTILPFFESLRQQGELPRQVVVCDGGSTDQTVERIQKWHDENQPSWELTLFVEPGANIAKGRNRAISKARYEHLAITDAGATLKGDWLQRILAPFAIDNEIAVSAGWYSVDARTALVKGLLRFIVPRLEAVDANTVLPSSRSMACTREAWSMAGGYPEYLTFAGEDTAFSKSLRTTGAQWAFVPEAQVVWIPPSKKMWNTLQRYAIGDAEAGNAGSYYLELCKRVLPILGDLLLAALLALLAIVYPSNLLLLIAAALSLGACYKAWNVLAAYQPYCELERDGTTTFWRTCGLIMLLSAQCLGWLKGVGNRKHVRQKRIAANTRVILVERDTPLGTVSSIPHDIRKYLFDGQYLLVVYKEAFLDGAQLLHPRLEQWPAADFDLKLWSMGCPLPILHLDEAMTSKSDTETEIQPRKSND